MRKKIYSFNAKVWLYGGDSANWHFVTLPKTLGQEIKAKIGSATRGFGSVPVTLTIGKTTWDTSIFPDKYSGSYLLPLKAKVRKAEDIFVDDTISVSLKIR